MELKSSLSLAPSLPSLFSFSLPPHSLSLSPALSLFLSVFLSEELGQLSGKVSRRALSYVLTIVTFTPWSSNYITNLSGRDIRDIRTYPFPNLIQNMHWVQLNAKLTVRIFSGENLSKIFLTTLNTAVLIIYSNLIFKVLLLVVCVGGGGSFKIAENLKIICNKKLLWFIISSFCNVVQ